MKELDRIKALIVKVNKITDERNYWRNKCEELLKKKEHEIH